MAENDKVTLTLAVRAEGVAWAPTAVFRWAKSSPSAPPVLQQQWGRVYDDLVYRPGGGATEWREVETVVLEYDPALKVEDLPEGADTARYRNNVAPVFTVKAVDVLRQSRARPDNLPEACPVCGGDCSAANPPVMFCPMRPDV